MSNRQIKALISIALAIVLVIVGYAAQRNEDKIKNIESRVEEASPINDQLTAYFIDVGQGDCEFIALPNGNCMLIDAGEAENASLVISKISSLGYKKIDYLVVTHPHTDHMGAMSQIIDSFNIGKIYMPRAQANTRTYEKLLNKIADKGLKINTAKAGVKVYESTKLNIDFVAPNDTSYEDLNNYSAVLRIKYGASSFLFTGDAEKLAEKEIIDAYSGAIQADVLKVGHHGSRYSSCNDFLYEVMPRYAIIECGKDNSYGHPHKQAVDRLKKASAEILRTDLDGDISISTKGDRDYIVTTHCFNGTDYELDN